MQKGSKVVTNPRGLLVIFFLVTMAVPAFAQSEDLESKPFSLSDLGSLGGLAGLGSDLRQSTETFAQCMVILERLAGPALVAAELISRNVAETSSGFDPFGMKESLRTIRTQQETIRKQHQQIVRLQRREIQQLKREIAELEAVEQGRDKRQNRRSEARRRPVKQRAF